MKHFVFFLLLLFFSPALSLGAVPGEAVADSTNYFPAKLLNQARQNAGALLQKFSYTETEVFEVPSHDTVISLANAYASAPLRNPGDYHLNRKTHQVSRIDIVFTKYPLHKQDWRTNYYDLLAWRLMALFELDPLLNDPEVEWGLVLQTQGKTDARAREMFHGIILYLEPLENFAQPQERLEDFPDRGIVAPIDNKGYIMPQDRHPDFFQSRLIFEPDSGSTPRRNMSPRDLKCPSWR